ncbi:unnamed protein product, partial [Didymodactylos carnosus]
IFLPQIMTNIVNVYDPSSYMLIDTIYFYPNISILYFDMDLFQNFAIVDATSLHLLLFHGSTINITLDNVNLYGGVCISDQYVIGLGPLSTIKVFSKFTGQHLYDLIGFGLFLESCIVINNYLYVPTGVGLQIADLRQQNNSLIKTLNDTVSSKGFWSIYMDASGRFYGDCWRSPAQSMIFYISNNNISIQLVAIPIFTRIIARASKYKYTFLNVTTTQIMIYEY